MDLITEVYVIPRGAGRKGMTYSYMHIRDANYYAGAVLVNGAVKEIRTTSWQDLVQKMAEFGVQMGEKE
jgi:hypothetical protein